jgi:Tfp pilus assembly protein PilF
MAGGAIGLVVAASLVVATLPLAASLYADEGDLRTAMAVQPLDATYPERAGDAEKAAGFAASDSNQRARHFARADGYYRRALEAQPEKIGVLFNLALTNSAWAIGVDARRFAVADHWWKRALSINPHDPPMRQRVEESRQEMERAGDALATTAAGGGGTSAASWIAAGRAFAGAHAFPKATAALKTALQLNPGDREATDLMAMVASNESAG